MSPVVFHGRSRSVCKELLETCCSSSAGWWQPEAELWVIASSPPLSYLLAAALGSPVTRVSRAQRCGGVGAVPRRARPAPTSASRVRWSPGPRGAGVLLAGSGCVAGMTPSFSSPSGSEGRRRCCKPVCVELLFSWCFPAVFLQAASDRDALP